MYIGQIRISFEYGVRDDYFRSIFDFRIYFLEYSLWRFLHKMKFETDGTFDSIFIDLGSEIASARIEHNPVNKMLIVELPFDYHRYENGNDKQRCEYYIELLQAGLQEAAKLKEIPFEELMSFAKELADNGFVYKWSFKNIILKEYNLKVKFVSELSTNDYILRLQAFQGRDSLPICEGQVARTKPYRLYFSYISKKINVVNGHIILDNEYQEHILSIDIRNLLERYLVIEYSECPDFEYERDKEIFLRFQKEISYSNNNFE